MPVPTAYIIGGPDLHVDKGSTINLTCSVRYSIEPPAYIFWFHHDEVSIGSIRNTFVCTAFIIHGTSGGLGLGHAWLWLWL